MAEEVRFELTEGYKPSPVFKTGAFNRSAIPPLLKTGEMILINGEAVKQ